MFGLFLLLVGLALIPIARRRRSLCTWSAEKVSTYKTMSILGLVFSPGFLAVPPPLLLIGVGVFWFSIYNLTMAVCRRRDLAQERAMEASAQ